MPIPLSNKKPLDPKDPSYKAFLDDLQGNILASHGRENVLLLPVEFTCGEQEARSWIRAFGRGWVTSASRQSEQTVNYRNDKSEALFANLFLTRRGYEYIGLKGSQIPADPKFRAGMSKSQALLKDTPPNTWEPQYDPAQRTLHAMVLLAATTLSKFKIQCNEIGDSLGQLGKVALEVGHASKDVARRETDRRYVEEFNYVDGRSQPLFLQEDIDTEEDLDGTSDYDPFAPLGLVLVKDPNGGEDGYGSYLVYRRLEQNVRGFKERALKPIGDAKSPQSLADVLGLTTTEDRKRVGAMVIGRFENGTPLALCNHSHLRSAPNNFNYDDDPHGLKCPLFAHIRKVNPRTEESRRRRIVRRGISYEYKSFSAPAAREKFEQMPIDNVGLHFMCFQSSIEAQFEYLQRLANDPDLPTPNAGADPLIGQSNESKHWVTTWGKSTGKKAPFGNFVTLKGGEYFFAPCLSFFEGLPSHQVPSPKRMVIFAR